MNWLGGALAVASIITHLIARRFQAQGNANPSLLKDMDTAFAYGISIGLAVGAIAANTIWLVTR